MEIQFRISPVHDVWLIKVDEGLSIEGLKHRVPRARRIESHFLLRRMKVKASPDDGAEIIRLGEVGDRSVSLDLLIKSLLALGVTNKDIGKAITHSSSGAA